MNRVSHHHRPLMLRTMVGTINVTLSDLKERFVGTTYTECTVETH